jgi:UDP-GlcNAc:undecaprenyl-phosphate GlcNAc-1-phosphate transferase
MNDGTAPVIDAPLFWVGAVLMLGAGYWDDRFSLDPKGKFFLQIIAAYLLLHGGVYVDLSPFSATLGEPYSQALFSIPLSILWVVGVINAVNLIDGLDGLATGIVGIAFFACALLFGMNGSLGLMGFGLMVVGPLVAFLVFNFKPASIFMGDCGSLFLGYLLAAYTLQAPMHVDPIIALLIPPMLIGLPILDTVVAIARRVMSERGIFAPDSRHIHHRLVEEGTERSAVLVLYGVGIWFGSAALLMGVLSTPWGYGLAAGTLVLAGLLVWRLGCLEPIPAEATVPVPPADRPVLSAWNPNSPAPNGSAHREAGTTNGAENPQDERSDEAGQVPHREEPLIHP